MTKSRFSYAKHKVTGCTLKQMHDALVHLQVDIHNSYPQSAKVYDLSTKAAKALDELRSELDNQLFRDCPNDDYRDVYYGPTREPALIS
jgi:hypothetical protein